MKTEANLSIVRSFYEALSANDAPAALALMSEDIEWLGMEGWPYKARDRGPAAVAAQIFAPLMNDWEDFCLVTERYLKDGGTIVALGRYVGRYIHTGGRLDAAFAHVWDVRNGRLFRFSQYADTLLVERARR